MSHYLDEFFGVPRWAEEPSAPSPVDLRGGKRALPHTLIGGPKVYLYVSAPTHRNRQRMDKSRRPALGDHAIPMERLRERIAFCEIAASSTSRRNRRQLPVFRQDHPTDDVNDTVGRDDVPLFDPNTVDLYA